MTASTADTRSDAHHLAPEELERLRAALLAELAAHRDHVAELQETADSLLGEAGGEGLVERELAEHNATRALEVLAEIEQALERLDQGTYGRCEQCGRALAPERLEAIPHARHCTSCPSAAVRLFG